MSELSFIPSNDNLLVIVEEAPTMRGGLYMPETAVKDGLQKAKVIAVGLGKVTTIGRIAPVVTPGMTVWFGAQNSVGVTIEGEKYTLVSESNLVGYSN